MEPTMSEAGSPGFQPQAPAPKAGLSSVSDLISGAYDLYKRLFWRVVSLSVCSFLVSMIVAVYAAIVAAVFIAMGMASAKDFPSGFSFAGPMIVALGIAVLIGLVILGVVIYFASSFTIGSMLVISRPEENPTFGDAFRNGRRRVWGFLAVSLLTALIVMVGIVLLIIPGIILGVYYSFAVWVYLLEGRRGMDALNRSKELVKDFWWPVVGRYFLLYLIIAIIYLVIGAATSGAPDAAKSGFNLINQIVNIVVGPFFIAYSYLIYKELVEIKGGFMPDMGTEPTGPAPIEPVKSWQTPVQENEPIQAPSRQTPVVDQPEDKPMAIPAGEPGGHPEDQIASQPENKPADQSAPGQQR